MPPCPCALARLHVCSGGCTSSTQVHLQPAGAASGERDFNQEKSRSHPPCRTGARLLCIGSQIHPPAYSTVAPASPGSCVVEERARRLKLQLTLRGPTVSLLRTCGVAGCTRATYARGNDREPEDHGTKSAPRTRTSPPGSGAGGKLRHPIWQKPSCGPRIGTSQSWASLWRWGRWGSPSTQYRLGKICRSCCAVCTARGTARIAGR